MTNIGWIATLVFSRYTRNDTKFCVCRLYKKYFDFVKNSPARPCEKIA